MKISCMMSRNDHRTQRVKIHYIGYSSRYDEWRPLSDIVDKRTSVMNEDSSFLRLHTELACFKN